MDIKASSEFHGFFYASKGTYALRIFARSANNSDLKIILITAKSKVVPLKTLSMQGLELVACCMHTHFENSAAKALN